MNKKFWMVYKTGVMRVCFWFFVKRRGVKAYPEGRRGEWKTKEFFDRALQLEAPWFMRNVKLDLQEKN